MFCYNCGQQLANNAKYCWKCGSYVYRGSHAKENPSSQDAPKAYGLLVIERNNNPYNTAPAEIWINGRKSRLINNGETVSIKLPVGVHNIMIEQEGQESLTNTVEINEGERKIFTYRAADLSARRSAPTDAPAYNRTPVKVQQYSGRICPRCGGIMTTHIVTESRKTGCGTILLYIILALTILGLFIVIPLALRKKTETVTYAVCQNCGHQIILRRE